MYHLEVESPFASISHKTNIYNAKLFKLRSGEGNT